MSAERYEESKLYRIRHSVAHIMAEAVLERFPGAKVAIGPPIADGFYYDFELPRSPEEADIKWVEKRMKKIIGGNHQFGYREITPDEGREIFADQPYKLELIDDLVAGRVDENGDEIAAPADKLSIYQHNTFTDLCRGPHIESTKEINAKSVSITFKPVAGAYWRGDEKRQQLTRIYGTAWESPTELKEYLQRLEEARKRDHRLLGEKLNLFVIDPLVGKGLPMWKPKGTLLRDTLERFLRDEQERRGYDHVMAPHIGSLDLYRTSGHYPYYKDSQYAPIDIDGDQYLLKPMNCPHHCRLFSSDLHSYKELPIRFAEFGTVYRYEKSGELHGLTRVRGFTQDDAHLFVMPDQLEDEFLGVVDLIEFVYNSVGLVDYRARVGVRDAESDKYVGSDENWELATKAIIKACDKRGINYTVEEGEAAFYGPKLDFIIKDMLGREWQISTVQVDYNLPERFELEYVSDDNDRQRPIMIHRALYGSMERFVAVVIEHFAGAFPVWLSPVQVMVIPVADGHNEYADKVADYLKKQGIRAEADKGKGRMNKKIREHRGQRIPYMLIVGDRDIENGTVSIRLRSDEDLGAMPLEDFGAMIKDNIANRSLELK
jgi:threonyl-tRNA synthetase